jgi:hypothetical protein
MDIGFANPGLLPLLALGAGPVLIHLLARQRPPRQDFSTLRFLSPLHRESRRASRPRDLLLLLLRTLFILLLLAAFTRPLLFESGMQSRAQKARRLVILVDASLSMRAGRGGVTRFAEAVARASEVLESLRHGDRANLVFVGRTPRPVFPALSANHEGLRAALAEAAPTAEGDSFAAALRLAVRQLAAGKEDADVSRELYLVSDFQSRRWRTLEPPALPAGTRLFCLRCRVAEPGPPGNVALTGLSTSPARPVAGETLRVTASVANHGPTPYYSEGVILRCGPEEQARSVRLEPWSEGTVTFRLPVRAAGWLPLSVRLAAEAGDALALDNERHRAVAVEEALPVALQPAEAPIAEPLRRALAPFGDERDRVRITAVAEPEVLPGAEPALLLLAGTARAPNAAALTWVEEGGALLWALPAQAPVRGELPGGWRLGPPAAGGEGRHLSVAAPEDPVLAVFEHGASGDLARATFHGVRPLRGGEGTVILALGEAPGLVRVPLGRGRVFLWNLPLASSDFARRSTFLPLVQEILAACRTGGALPSVRVGEPLVLRPTAAADPAELRLRGPGGEPLRPETRSGERGLEVGLAGVAEPGLVRLARRGRLLALGAVNPDPAESDLRSAAAETLGLAGGGAREIANRTELSRLGAGEETWPRLLLFALVMLLGEGAVLLFWRPPLQEAPPPEGDRS